MCRSGNRAQGHPAHYGSSARQARQAEGTDHAGNGQGVMVVAPASSAVMPGVRVIVLAPAALQNFSFLYVSYGSSTTKAVKATARRLSALPRKADIRDLSRHVGFRLSAQRTWRGAANRQLYSIAMSARASSVGPVGPRVA